MNQKNAILCSGVHFRKSKKLDSSENRHIQQWNPMEVDFLATKNNYTYDEEDASVAVQGYSKYAIDLWYGCA